MEASRSDPPGIPARTYSAGGAQSRVDIALLNEAASDAFDRLWVGDEEEYAFPGHRPVFVQFQWSGLWQRVRRLKSPAPIPLMGWGGGGRVVYVCMSSFFLI